MTKWRPKENEVISTGYMWWKRFAARELGNVRPESKERELRADEFS